MSIRGQQIDQSTLPAWTQSWAASQDKLIELSTKVEMPMKILNTDDRDWTSYALEMLRVTDERLATEVALR